MEEEGEGGGRGGVCFSSGARLQSEVDMEKPGNGKIVQREVAACLSRAPKPALSFTRPSSVKFCCGFGLNTSACTDFSKCKLLIISQNLVK